MTHTEDLPQFGMKLEVYIKAGGEYKVNVFTSTSPGYWEHLSCGPGMLPPDIIRNAKLKLWEKIKP